MSDTDPKDTAAPAKEPEPRPESPRSRLPLRIGWWALRLVVLGGAVLLVAHWLAGATVNGWIQLGGAAALCLGLPLVFQIVIRRQSGRMGGKARFRWLTLAMLINAPVLIWVGARHPATIADDLEQEGVGALKWIAYTIGVHEPGTTPTDPDADAGGPGDVEPGPGEAAGGSGDGGSETVALPRDAGDAPGSTTFEPSGAPIPFENHAGQLVIEARIGDGDPLPFVLDTGATYSTLNAATLTALGIEVPADAPLRTMRTAGGEAEGPMVLLDSVTVGEQRREGVSFWVCEPCANEGTVGLLGLNVWQGFLLTIDPSQENIWLQPKEGPTNRLYDVESFLDITSPTSRIEGETVYVDLLLSNTARRDVDQAVVLVTARDESGRDLGAITVDAGGIPGLGSTMATGTMPGAGRTAQLTFSLIDARW